MSPLILESEALMAEFMKGYDSSHDMYHVRRVRDLALRIAEDAARTQPVDLEIVELSAIFHDLVDHKYADGTDRINVLRTLLEKHNLGAERANMVIRIVEDTGFSRERKLKEAGLWTSWHGQCIEFACVQDADRLDAIGAFGVMRVSAYASRVNHALFDPSPDVDSAYKHFYDKLLKLSSTMRTPLGQRLGAKRNAFMEAFLQELRDEYHFDAAESA